MASLIRGFICRCEVLGDLVGQCPAFCQAAAERLNIPLIALPALGLRGRLCRIRQRRSRRQPEAHEERQCLVGNGDVALQTFDLSDKPVQPAAERSFKSFGGIRRQEGCEGGFHDVCLRHPLARSVIGQLERDIRW